MTDPAPPLADTAPAWPAPPRRRPRRTLVSVAGYVAFAVLLAVVVLDGGFSRTDTTGKVHQQPASVSYTDEYGLHPTHYVGLIHHRSLVFGRHQGYELYTGSEKNLSYGHFVDLDLPTIEEQPSIKAVNWSEEGVRVTFTSGHEVFVPARYYVGGR